VHVRLIQQIESKQDSKHSGGPNGDLPGLRLLHFRELQPEHAVVELRVDLRLIDRLRQTELAEERPGLVLAEDIGLFRSLWGRDLRG
jgi:hypothetical protein